MQITYASKTIQRLCEEDKHQHALSKKCKASPAEAPMHLQQSKVD
jgi:hypothetical protein